MKTDRTKSGYSGRDYLTIILVLIIVPCCLYWRTTGYEFVWDDIQTHFGKNSYSVSPSLENLPYFWKGIHEGLYIPMSYTIWGFLNSIGDIFPQLTGAPIFHAANILIHTCNGLLVFLLLNQFVRTPWAAAAGALIFLIHPLQVESVAWVSELRGLSAALFMLSALYFYLLCCKLKHGNGDNYLANINYFASLALFTLSLLCKPTTVIMPFIAAAIEYYFFNRLTKSSAFHLGSMIIPVLLIAWVTGSAQDHAIGYPIWIKPFLYLYSITFYIYKTVYPLGLSPSYAMRPDFLINQWWFYGSVFIPLSISVLIWRIKKNNPIFLISALIFVVGILPVSGLKEFVFQEWSTVADRYVYISMFGISLSFAYIASVRRRLWQKGIMISILILLSALSFFVQIPVWKNNQTLWNTCIDLTPTESKAFNSRGADFLSKGMYQKALDDFKRSISLNPNHVGTYHNLGLVYEHLGDSQKAILSATKAIELNPEFFIPYLTRGRVYYQLKNYPNAISDFTAGIQYEPKYDSSYLYRAKAYFRSGLLEKALNDLDFLLKLTPTYNEAYLLRGHIHNQMKNYKEAIANFDYLIKLDPGTLIGYLNKGIVLIKERKYKNALEVFNQAEAISDKSFNIYFHRGDTYQYLGQYENAIADYDRAAHLVSDNPNLFGNRAAAYYLLNEHEKAARDIKRVQSLGGTPNPSLLKLLQPYLKHR